MQKIQGHSTRTQ